MVLPMRTTFNAVDMLVRRLAGVAARMAAAALVAIADPPAESNSQHECDAAQTACSGPTFGPSSQPTVSAAAAATADTTGPTFGPPAVAAPTLNGPPRAPRTCYR